MEPAELKQIVKEKVIGKWIPEHDVFGHHYRFAGTDIVEDSVTTKNIIDKPHLIPWAVGKGIEYLEEGNRFELLQNEETRKETIVAAKFHYKEERDQAGDIGSIAHNAIEDYVNQWIDSGVKPSDIRDFIKDKDNYRPIASARAAESIFNKNDVTPISTEIVVGIAGLGAGTLDMLILNNKTGKLELWDWKTSNTVNDFYAIQVSVYAKMFEHMTGLKISKCKIFKLDKNSDRFKMYLVPRVAENFRVFKALNKVYKWQQDERPKLSDNKKTIKI